MTVLAERPVTHEHEHEHHEGPTGLLKWLTSTDHKLIGMNYMVTSLIMFFLAGIMALLLRTQLASPDSSFLSFQQYNALFTMHGSLMLYLFAGPFAFGGLANYILPLQIGAPDMAFPRLNALSYWLYLGGSITMLLGFLVAGGAAAYGWVAYAPLSTVQFAPGSAPDLWILGIALTGFSAIFTGVNLVTTTFYLRAPGMTMFRLPIFTWNMLVTAILILIAFPILTAAMVLLFADRHFGTHIYSTAGGGVAGALSEPLLVLRPSRGLHPGLALFRHRDRRHPRLLQEAALRLQGHGLRHHGHRRAVHRGVGAPHVHDRRGAPPLLLAVVPAHRRAHGDQVLQLDRHHVAGAADLQHAHAVLHRVPVRLLDGRPDRRHVGVAPHRLRHPRHLLRGGPLPPGAVRHRRVRRVRRVLLLVPEVLRPDVPRNGWARRTSGSSPSASG